MCFVGCRVSALGKNDYMYVGLAPFLLMLYVHELIYRLPLVLGMYVVASRADLHCKDEAV